jgi:hypothetical protein
MRMSYEARVVTSSREADPLATRGDMESLSADPTAALHFMGDALTTRLGRLSPLAKRYVAQKTLVPVHDSPVSQI